jgi:hypothetical protein
MPVYLVLAYIVFIVVPSALWLSIYIRQREVTREINLLEKD